MNSRLISWGRGVYLAGIVLALVLVIPVAWFPFQLAKVTVFALCALIAALLFTAAGGLRELLRSRGFVAALLVALLPLAYVISWRFALDPSVAYAGFGLESDTVIFALLAFLAFVLSFAFFRTLRTVRLLLTVLSCALALAVVFQLISIVFGSNVIPLSTFADRSVNLVGKWNDLGLLVSMLMLLVLCRAELMVASLPMRTAAAVAAVVLALLLGVINFSVAWSLVLAGAIGVGLVAFITQRAPEGEGRQSMLQRVPWFSGLVAVAAVGFLLYGSAFNSGITNIFPVSSLEVRPSYQSTLEVWSASRSSAARFVVGQGPNSFGQMWLMHKPSEVNQTPFWSVDFNVGFSTLSTALTTVGLLGLLGWLVPLFLTLAGAVRAVRLSILRREDRGVAVALTLSSLFLFAALAFYVPSQNIVVLALVLAGASFGFLWRQGQEAAQPLGAHSRLAGIGIAASALVLIVLLLLVSFVSIRRFGSELFVNRGVVALQAGDATAALNNASTASRIEQNGDVLRLVVQAGGVRLTQIAQDKTLSQDQARSAFQSVLQQTVTAAQGAQARNPQDYRVPFGIASVYEYLATLGVQGAYESAIASYNQAQALSPQNPSIPFALARLEALKGNGQGAQDQISQALKLKPNYTDAILFVVQLAVAQNNIPLAIQAATAAAQTAPGVAPIWFELGLLYYAAGNAQNASLALQQAVTLVPDYANAKYFLGLSYAALGQQDKALAEFEDLAKSNPDNGDVKQILDNLQAGKSPFGTSTPSTKSQVKPPAPVSE